MKAGKIACNGVESCDEDADQIVVLEDGAVVGLGTHEFLLETCVTYVEIVESQQMARVVA